MPTITEFWRDPVLPYVESRRACNSRACYKPHSHPTFSIGAVDQGQSQFTGAKNGPVLIQVGSMVFVPSGSVHACNPVVGTAWSYQMLHLDAKWVAAVRQEASIENQEGVVLTHDPAVYIRFCTLNALLFSDADLPEKEAALIEFMGAYDFKHQEVLSPVIDPSAIRKTLEPVLNFLQHDVIGIRPLAELAEMAGMSRYQLIRSFRTATGMTPHTYQLNLCVNHARAWLHEGIALSDIAYRLGFADQSHFQRTFKGYAGVTPGSYRV